MGGDAQQGALSVMFDGPRVDATYDPMRKQGAILLGNGGDNSNGSQGTFYEGAMTAAGTFPTDATDQLVQANIVAAKYDVPRLSLAPASATADAAGTPDVLTGIFAGHHRDIHEHHRGARDGRPVEHLRARRQWTSVVAGTTETSKTFADPVAPGASVSATFKVTSGPAAFNGDLVGNAAWTNQTSGANAIRDDGREGAERQPDQDQRVPHQRRFATNPTNSFIELYNAGASERRHLQLDPDRAPDPAGHLLDGEDPGRDEARGRRLLPARPLQLRAGGPRARGRTTIHVRSTTGMSVGDTVRSTPAPTRRPARSPPSPHRCDRATGVRQDRQRRQARWQWRVRPTAGGHRQRSADFTVSAWVNPASEQRLVAGLRLRHRHHGQHVPDRQRRRRGASLRHHHRRRRCRAADRRHGHLPLDKLVTRRGDAVG